MIDSSPYNDALSPEDREGSRNIVDNKGLNVAISLSTNQLSSPYNDTFSPKDGSANTYTVNNISSNGAISIVVNKDSSPKT